MLMLTTAIPENGLSYTVRCTQYDRLSQQDFTFSSRTRHGIDTTKTCTESRP